MSENGEQGPAPRSIVRPMQRIEQNPEAAYRAFQTHDSRFDGHVFAGVSSTGVYCRPVCRVRTPMLKNCTFFRSAAAAEVEGYRPCLRCRPELAPGRSAVDATGRLARAAAAAIEDALAQDVDLPTIAQRLNVSDRHLRRTFVQEFGVTPVQYAQTQRLLLAKRLLTDTNLSITEAAFASGFSSLRRMNALFKEQYRLTPSALRHGERGRELAFTFLLPYRPPYDWQELLAFLGTRAIDGVERVQDGTYSRVLRVGDCVGTIHVRQLPNKHALELKCAPVFARCLPAVLKHTKRVFDLHADPGEIAEALGQIATGALGLRLPGAFDPFELGVRAILGQQITVRAARTLASRLAKTFGDPQTGGGLAFPTPAKVAGAGAHALAALGIVRSRADAIVALAEACASGAVDFSADSERVQSALLTLKGIGPWTSAYIAMRALSWPDAWLPRDVVLQRMLSLPNTAAGARAAETLSSTWRPWRSYAVLHLWKEAS
jgi:AraC family transcriptional regulator, regulatory protein of adaptative response / DNA-3-methyladenine glycosylase II